SKDLNQYLRENRIIGLAEIDTRALTRHLRSRGVLRGCLSTLEESDQKLVEKAKASPDLSTIDLVGQVTCSTPYAWDRGGSPNWAMAGEDDRAGNGGRSESSSSTASGKSATGPRVVAYDYGAKQNILRCLSGAGFRVTVVPASFPARDALELRPD